MANEEEEINIDDHDNVDQIEDLLENEEKEIIECFENDLNEFMKEVQDGISSANLPTPTLTHEEFLFQENPTKNRVSKSQEKIAEDLFKNKIQKSFTKEFWSRFKHFDFYIIVPKFLSLGIHLVYMEKKVSILYFFRETDRGPISRLYY